MRVIADGASIWSNPSVPGIVLATVKAGTTLEVVGQVGNWYRVKLPADSTREGYILIRQVEGSVGPFKPQVSPRGPQAGPARRRPPPRRAFVSVGGSYQPPFSQPGNEISFTEFVEEGSRTTKYKTQRGALLDLSYGVEATRGVFIAGAVSRFDGSSDVDIDQQIPHPFFFDRMRTLTGTATALKREELAVHFQAAGLVPINRRVHVFFGLGPSVFRLKQTIVKDVTYTQEYPFDEVTFASAQTELQERTRVGANVQLNIVTMVARHVGVDGLVRFSRASLSFTGPDGSKFSVRAGGLHVGIGIRAEF